MIRNILTGVALLVAIAALTMCFLEKGKQPVYIDIGEIYSEFGLSKELNKELTSVVNKRKEILDTLLQSLKMKKEAIQSAGKPDKEAIMEFEKMQQAYLYKDEQFQKENQSASNEYNTKIMNQLNQYIQEYGKEHKLSIVLGANGQGNIMYGDDSRNITKAVLAYVNSRYNGSKAK